MLALNSSIDYLLGGLHMKITKQVKGIILAGVVALVLGVVVITTRVTGGYAIGSSSHQTLVCIDPPGN